MVSLAAVNIRDAGLAEVDVAGAVRWVPNLEGAMLRLAGGNAPSWLCLSQ